MSMCLLLIRYFRTILLGQSIKQQNWRMNCCNCKLRYNTTQRRPIISKCSHTLCEKCTDLLEKCPKCMRVFDKNSWIVNQAIIELIGTSNGGVDMLVKVCFIGEMAAGKTSLIKRMVDNQFNERLISSVGVDFKYIDKDIKGLNFRFQLWDTAGQQRFQAIFTKTYKGTSPKYKEADIVALVYDSTCNRKDSVTRWERQIQQKCRENIRTIYVANKIDLLKSSINPKGDFKVSCKTLEGVEELWEGILKIASEISRLQLQPKQTQVKIKARQIETRKFKKEAKKQKTGGGCC